MRTHPGVRSLLLALWISPVLLSAVTPALSAEPRTFSTPEEAVRALIDAVRTGTLDALLPLFGDDGRELAMSSDAATARRNAEVFLAAVAERWRLGDLSPTTKELVVGNEDWPFPIPLVRDSHGWRFDTAAGREEVLSRRIGRNELAVIRICQTYVAAQRVYAKRGHDGKPSGLYARRFQSAPGTEHGLYWPEKRGERRSPLGNLVAEAAAEGQPIADRQAPAPFHGYYFRILEAQGPAAPGGSREYVVGDDMSGGFALIAWPAQYGATGVMTFIVNHDGVVFERDLGPQTRTTAEAIRRFDPDSTWTASLASVNRGHP